jgi:hypothetical protein
MTELTEREKLIVEAVSADVTKQIQECFLPGNKHSDFWIGEKEHYNSHQRIERVLNMLDETSGTIRKTLIKLFCAVVVACMIAGAVWKLKGE